HPFVVAVGDAVREVGATPGDQLRRQRTSVGAGDVLGEEPAQRFEVDAFRTPRGHGGSLRAFLTVAGRRSETHRIASGDAGGAGPHGPASTFRVARHATDGHVDTEAGGRPLLFGLAAPEPVLAVLACPVATILKHR